MCHEIIINNYLNSSKNIYTTYTTVSTIYTTVSISTIYTTVSTIYTTVSTTYTTLSTIYTIVSTARCVLPTPLTTSPSPGVRCTTRAATATRRTRSPPAPGTQGQKYFSHSFKYFYASALLQVRDVQVSAVQVRLQPAGRGPGLLLLRGRRVQGGRHLIYISTMYISTYYIHIYNCPGLRVPAPLPARLHV